jgi:hypothetical protein
VLTEEKWLEEKGVHAYPQRGEERILKWAVVRGS